MPNGLMRPHLLALLASLPAAASTSFLGVEMAIDLAGSGDPLPGSPGSLMRDIFLAQLRDDLATTLRSSGTRVLIDANLDESTNPAKVRIEFKTSSGGRMSGSELDTMMEEVRGHLLNGASDIHTLTASKRFTTSISIAKLSPPAPPAAPVFARPNLKDPAGPVPGSRKRPPPPPPPPIPKPTPGWHLIKALGQSARDDHSVFGSLGRFAEQETGGFVGVIFALLLLCVLPCFLRFTRESRAEARKAGEPWWWGETFARHSLYRCARFVTACSKRPTPKAVEYAEAAPRVELEDVHLSSET